jgi:uncharacterized protein YjbI with pentapeptide repeats
MYSHSEIQQTRPGYRHGRRVGSGISRKGTGRCPFVSRQAGFHARRLACRFDANEENTMKPRMREQNSIKILALLGLAFLALCGPRLDAQEVVDIADENLEAAIRDALGIPTGPITDADLAGLTELQADLKAITDLTGLQYCVNLTVLSLANNNISGIKPLSGLKNLTELNLSGNNISQVKPLSRLRNLTGLCLSYNNISDISPLSRLTNLRDLYLHYNNISEIKPLPGLRNLTSLCLSYNNISDISPLSRLTNVRCLYLHYNNISDIGPLSRLTNLRFLYLYSNPVDCDAYLTFIPLITENNPGVDIFYDPLPPESS